MSYEGPLGPEYDICQSTTRNEDGGLSEIIIRGSVGAEDDNLRQPDIRVSRGTLEKSKENYHVHQVTYILYHKSGMLALNCHFYVVFVMSSGRLRVIRSRV